MNLICYTIGHSKHTAEQFANLIKPHDIDLIIDVRSIPYSRFAPQFNRSSVKQTFNQFNLNYEYMGDMIGGKFSGIEFLSESGCIDFYKVIESQAFKKGIDIIISKIYSELKIALMCAEKDPLYCHRFLLISRELNNRGIKTVHLLADGSAISDKELLNNETNKTKNTVIQMDLFTDYNKTYEDRVYETLMMKKMKKMHSYIS